MAIFSLLGIHAAAGIGHGDGDAAVADALGDHQDLAALGGEFVGVAQQVDQNLPDAAGIHRQVRQALGNADLQALLLGADPLAHHGQQRIR